MLTFTEFIGELAGKNVSISPADVKRLQERFGDRVLMMGHLQDDGSIFVPVECVLEAARSLGATAIADAAEALRNGEMATMLESVGTLVDEIALARDRKVRDAVQSFQSEPNEIEAQKQWKEIEKLVFGVDFPD